jgi:oligopeptide transport system ATP-binding protein
VMYLGRIVETAPKDVLFANPRHPYSRTLLSAIPRPDPHRQVVHQIPSGDVPSPMNPPPGCRFHTRCPFAIERCRVEDPPLKSIEPNHLTACHRSHELPAFTAREDAHPTPPRAARRMALYAERRERVREVAG